MMMHANAARDEMMALGNKFKTLCTLFLLSVLCGYFFLFFVYYF